MSYPQPGPAPQGAPPPSGPPQGPPQAPPPGPPQGLPQTPAAPVAAAQGPTYQPGLAPQRTGSSAPGPAWPPASPQPGPGWQPSPQPTPATSVPAQSAYPVQSLGSAQTLSSTEAPAAGDPKIHRRAILVSRIFEVLALIVAVLGVAVSVLILLSGFGLLSVRGTSNDVVAGIVGFVLGLLVTAIYWAATSLASLVAGYIAQRSKQ